MNFAALEIIIIVKMLKPIADFASRRFNISQFTLARGIACIGGSIYVALIGGCLYVLPNFHVRHWYDYALLVAIPVGAVWGFIDTRKAFKTIRLREEFAKRAPQRGNVIWSSAAPGSRVMQLGFLIVICTVAGAFGLWGVSAVNIADMYFVYATLMADVPEPPKFKKWFSLPKFSFGEPLPQGAA